MIEQQQIATTLETFDGQRWYVEISDPLNPRERNRKAIAEAGLSFYRSIPEDCRKGIFFRELEPSEFCPRSRMGYFGFDNTSKDYQWFTSIKMLDERKKEEGIDSVSDNELAAQLRSSPSNPIFLAEAIARLLTK